MRRFLRFAAAYGILAAFWGLFAFLAATKTDTFFTSNNLTNVLRQNSFTAVLAAGIGPHVGHGQSDLEPEIGYGREREWGHAPGAYSVPEMDREVDGESRVTPKRLE